jgi:NADH:ubiquinone oxidoreductase subunit 6 (subunit J)
MSQVLFFIAAIGALSGAIGVVMLRNPFFSVLSLAFHLVSLAALFLLLRAEFVAAAQVIVYAGAVMVLYTFVVSYVGGHDAAPRLGEPLGRPPGRALTLAAWACGGALVLELFIAVLGSGLKALDTRGATLPAGFGSPDQIGQALLTSFLAPFEIASFLLLVAAVGAVVLARRRRGLPDDEEDEPMVPVIRPGYTGTLAEAAGVRPGFATDPETHEPERAATPGTPATTSEGGW